MMKISSKFALIGLLLCVPTMAAQKIITVNSQGYGETEHLAIEDALSIAVGQFHGVDVDHQQARQLRQSKDDGELTTLNAISGATTVATKGHVTRYRIVEMNCSQRCTASLEVDFSQYDVPGPNPDRRRRIVVAPFAGDNNGTLTDALQRTIVSSRRFSVLDRQHNEAYEKEAQLLMSGQASAQEKIRLGQVMGLDYLVIGELHQQDTALTPVQYQHSLTGETMGRVATGYVEYSIILLATRQIMKQVEIPVYGADDVSSAGKWIAHDIVDAIYPLKIIDVQADEVVVNIGEGFVEPGQHYTVYAQGKTLRDPYHGESLGKMETAIGKVVISQVKPKFSIAHIIEGQGLTMHDGILRLATATESPIQDNTPASLNISPSGGVVLPLMKK